MPNDALIFEEASKLTPADSDARTFESLTGEPRYVQNIAKIFTRTEELQQDADAIRIYQHQAWAERGEALRRQDLKFRDTPVSYAISHLIKTLPFETVDKFQTRRFQEWQETGAKNQAVREFFQRRKQIANGLWNQVHVENPEISDEDAYRHMHQQLEQYGFQPPGAGKLPPLVMRKGQWENDYVPGWTEFRGGIKGIATGAQRLVTTPKKLGTMAGEAVHDWMHQDTMGAEVTGTNVYRDIRGRMEIRDEQIQNYLSRGIGKIPYLPEGFNIYEILGEQMPQFTLMAGTAGLVKAGLVTKFMGRTATAATMFALETTDAYQQYMQYAEDKNMDPRTASQIAAGGAVAYGAVSSVLETYGPFELLSRKSPKAFSRITQAAIMSLAEGGTEFTQAMTQHGIAHGLDLKDIDMDQVREAMVEAVAGMIMGGAVGATMAKGQGRTAEPPQIAGPGMNIDPGEAGPTTEAVPVEAVPIEVTPEITPSIGPSERRVEGPTAVPTEQFIEQHRVAERELGRFDEEINEELRHDAQRVLEHAEEWGGSPEVIAQRKQHAQEVLDTLGQPTTPVAPYVTREAEITKAEIPSPPAEFVKKTVSLVRQRLGKEGSKIIDDASLERVGNEIARIVGIPEDIEIVWEFKIQPEQKGGSATHWETGRNKHKILVRHGLKVPRPKLGYEKLATQAGMKPVAGLEDVITPSRSSIYREIIHELGHIVVPPTEIKTGRRRVHFPEFATWVEEGVSKLLGTTYVKAPDIEPLTTPDNVPMAEDRIPAPEEPGEAPISIGREVKSLLSDETGSWDPEATGRVIAGGITVATEEAGSLWTGLAALTDETAALRKTDAGSLADELLSDAQAKAQRKIGEHNSKFLGAYDKLTTDEKRWLETIREDGQTNWATLREHPDRLDPSMVSQGVVALAQVATDQQRDSAQGAIDSRLPQARADGTIGIFQPAKEGRYYRILTPKGAATTHSQTGPTWEALITWLEKYSDRNPDLPDTAAEIREKLTGEQRSGKTKKANSLEYTRVFKELPTALFVNGKWEAFQEMRPTNHFMSSNESQWRRIMFWDVIQERLLPLYGTFNEETGKMELPHPANKELTDVDSLIDRLRRDIVTQGGPEKTYNRLLEHYFRQFQGGVMEEVFSIADSDNRLLKMASIADRNIMASILSFSGLWDVAQPTASIHIVGARRLTKAYAKVIADTATDPHGYSAEYQAIGAVMLRHNDWTLRRTTGELTRGVLERTVPQAMMRGAEAMEQWSQTVTATAFDIWLREVNGKLRDSDARMLKKHLRLTDAEILEIARGEVSDATRAKVLQNGVKTTNFLAEDPMHRGLMQNIPLLRFLVPFTSVVSGNLRSAGRVVTDMADDVKRIKRGDKKAVGDLMRSTGKMATFITACFGRGFVQNILRRLITGKPLIRPEEEESWVGTVVDSLGEGAIFGPYWRLMEAVKYSGGDPHRMAVNMMPRMAIWLDAITAMWGLGKYEGTPWGRRMERWGYKVSPAARSVRNWYNKMIKPGREEYAEVRQRVRLFREKEGEAPARGYGPTNRYYYAVFEAVRDQDESAIRETLVEYKEWAKAEGRTPEEARQGLRASLQARRPMDLRQENMEKFLAGLSDEQREKAKRIQREYSALMDKITRQPGAKRKRKTREKRKKKQRGGDWYVD